MNLDLFRTYKGILALLFLLAASSTMALPIVLIFATEQLGATPFQGALVFVCTAFVGMLIVPQIGKFSDRTGRHKTIMVVAVLWYAIGPFIITQINNITQMIMVAVIFMSIFAVPSAQLFAIARQRLEQSNTGQSEDISSLRIAHIAGWVVGPIVPGVLLTAGLSFRNLYFIQGCSFLVIALIAYLFLQAPRAKPVQPKVASPSEKPVKLPLEIILVCATVALVLGGDMIRVAGLPLYVVQDLKGSVASVSFAFSIVPMVEIPATILAIWIAKRFGEPIAMLMGTLAALAYFVSMPFATEIWQIYAIQVIYALVPAATIGVAIAYIQSLLPGRPGYSSSLAFSAQSGAIVLGNIFLAGGVLLLGMRLTFFIPVASSLIGLFCVGVLIMRQRTPQALPASPINR